MKNIFEEIKLERLAQDKEWGGPAHDDKHSIDDWLLQITKQIGKNVDKTSKLLFKDRMIKIAALAVAGIESMDRQIGYNEVTINIRDKERGFIRPFRQVYIHETCGQLTKISSNMAIMFATNPGFYREAFCVNCKTHRPVGEFRWEGDDKRVGS